jgi:hypothetical protein
MRGQWRAGGAVAAAGLAGLLLGCSSDPEGPDGGGQGGGGPTTSPLAEILGWGMVEEGGTGSPGVSEEERGRHDRVERLTAECMTDHGFEYLPVPLPEAASGPFEEAYALPPDEFAARYGYGVTTLAPPTDGPVRDPNQEILASLPPDIREDYQRALWGDAVTGGEGTEPGCQQWASAQVYEDGAGSAELHARFKELFDHLDALWQRIENDPRLEGADEGWVTCMAQAGYPGFDRPHDARQSVFDGMAALRAQADPDPDELASLREYELALAPVDQQCREVHIDGPRRAVAYELEAEFVAEHRAELEAYRDWVSGEVGDG